MLALPATAAEPPSVAAVTVSTPIVLDGALDEPAWAKAGLIAGLTQQAPRPGEKTPYGTSVRFLVDGTTLYVGFTCADPQPQRIAIHTMQRDGAMEGDDTVALAIAPFSEGRNGYLFRINAAAARLDGLVAGPDATSPDWDGIWDAAARRTPEGWTAEIAIQARTLRFPRGQDRWRVEVERTVARERMTLRWSGTTLDSMLDDFGRSGWLTGVSGLRQGVGLSIAPYGLARHSKDFEADHRTLTGSFGLDASYSVTPQLDAVLTLSTDFAETEVDARQVNLTRFPLFFPEKRPFFLEGSELFEFGLELGEAFVPFYSRRIGLFEGERVPIDFGGKVLGRVGPLGVALLDVQTGSTAATPRTQPTARARREPRSLAGAEGSRSNLFAGRVTYDVDSHLRVGTLVTRGDPGGARDNTLFGLDAVWRTSTFAGDKNLAAGVWFADSEGDVADGRRTGWGLKIDYPNDLWDVSLKYKDFGDALEPALGFLPRRGIRDYQVDVAYQPRPKRGFVQQYFFQLETLLITDLSGETESFAMFVDPFDIVTRAGDAFQISWVPQYEQLVEPFEVVEGAIVPPGEYTFHRVSLEAESSPHRSLRGSAEVTAGDFYDGTLTEVMTSASWTSPEGHVQVELRSQNAYGEVPSSALSTRRSFITRLHQLKTTYSPTPRLVLSAYLQYDNESHDLGVNARLRYTPRPGTDVFLVWTRGWREHFVGAARDRVFRPEAEQAVLKLRWTFRP